MNTITQYCRLTSEVCELNGSIVARRDALSGDSWFKQLYKSQDFSYPKFYKMDLLAQAGYLCSEIIKKANPEIFTGYADDEIAMIFANTVSSADTDLRFISSYADKGSPSPALFVYTLPNIVLGELSILNKWYGEHIFCVLPKFAPGFFMDQCKILFNTGSRAALCGWLDILDGKTDVFLFWIETGSNSGMELNAANLASLANNTSSLT